MAGHEPRLRVEPSLVDKFKRLPGGMHEMGTRVQRDFGLKVDYDKVKDMLELSGAELPILRIAVDSLRFWVDEETFPDTGVSCQVGYPNKGIVIWRFHGDYAKKFDHLFEQDIAELKLIPTVNVKAVPNRRNPNHVEVYCMFSVYQRVSPQVDRIKYEISKLVSADFFVPKDDQARAKNFAKTREVDKTVLYVLKEDKQRNKVRVWIHGRENADVAKARREWISHVGQIAASSSGTDPDNLQWLNNLGNHKSSYSSEMGLEKRREMTEERQGSQIVGKIPEYDSMNFPRPSHMFHPVPREDSQQRGLNRMTSSGQPVGLDQWMAASTQVSPRLAKLTRPAVGRQVSEQQSGKLRGITSQVSGSKIVSETMETRNNNNRKFQMTATNESQGRRTKSQTLTPNVRYHCGINGLDIYMYRYSVVKLNGMDALVNVVAGDLKDGGSLSLAFEDAVGPVLDEERKIYLSANGPLPVTENYVTSAGKIPCTGIIHAVGPRWKDYEGHQQDAIKDLQTTVYNALKTAENHKYRKVGLPSISSEPFFGVPREICAEMYVTGIVNYCRQMGPLYPVLEVHLVDLNLEMLGSIKDAYEKWEASLTPHDVVAAKDFVTVGRPLDERPNTRPAHVSQNVVTFKDQSYLPGGQQVWSFGVLGQLRVHVYSSSILKVQQVDAIVCSLDGNLNGDLAKDIWETAGKMYQKSLENASFRRALQDGEVLVCDAGNLPVRSVMHAVISQPIRKASHKNLARLDHINSQILHTVAVWGMTAVAIPLLGTGRLRERFEVEQCALQLIDNIIEMCLSQGPKLKLRELHLVNINGVMTQYVLQALRTRAHTKVRLENFENGLSEKTAGKPKENDQANGESGQGNSHQAMQEERESPEDLEARETTPPAATDRAKTRRSSVRWHDQGEGDNNPTALRTKDGIESEGRDWVLTGRLRKGSAKTDWSTVTLDSDRDNGRSYTERAHTGKTATSQNSINTSRTDPGYRAKRDNNGRLYERRFTEEFDSKGNLIGLKPLFKDPQESIMENGESVVSDTDGRMAKDAASEKDIPWTESWSDMGDLWTDLDDQTIPGDQTDRYTFKSKFTGDQTDRNTYRSQTTTKSEIAVFEDKLTELTKPMDFGGLQSRRDRYNTAATYTTERVYKTEHDYDTTDQYTVYNAEPEDEATALPPGKKGKGRQPKQQNSKTPRGIKGDKTLAGKGVQRGKGRGKLVMKASATSRQTKSTEKSLAPVKLTTGFKGKTARRASGMTVTTIRMGSVKA